jgi:uncharacterized membrane protein YphA (DoxX/SURF4 family)
MTLSRLSRVTRLGASWLLGAWFTHLYVTMGWAKFDPASFWTALFEHWGFPPSFRLLIGAIEVTAGAALLVPWGTTYGAVALILVMIGAAGSLATDARWHDVLTVTMYAAGLAWIAWEWRTMRFRWRGNPGTPDTQRTSSDHRPV